MKPAVAEGESLFVDFTLTLGYDNYEDRALVLVAWQCSICDEEGRSTASMESHAREHAQVDA